MKTSKLMIVVDPTNNLFESTDITTLDYSLNKINTQVSFNDILKILDMYEQKYKLDFRMHHLVQLSHFSHIHHLNKLKNLIPFYMHEITWKIIGKDGPITFTTSFFITIEHEEPYVMDIEYLDPMFH